MTDHIDVATAFKRADLAVGENPPGTISLPPLEDQINNLPAQAGPLRRILESEAVRNGYTQKKDYGSAAAKARKSYDTSKNIILLLLLACLLTAAVPLLAPPILIYEQNSSIARGIATSLLYLCLLASLTLAWWLSARKLYETWSISRGAAEFLRRKHFDTVMNAPATVNPGEIAALPLKLEYFRRYQLDLQKAYFTKRSSENVRIAALAQGMLWPCGALVVAWLLFLFGEVLSAWGEQGPLPAFVPVWIYHVMSTLQGVSMEYADTKWLLYGTGAAIIYGASFLYTTLQNSQRNAARYTHARENFEYLSKQDLESARKSAAAGDEVGVNAFVNKVHSAMSAELSDWVRLMDLDQGKGPEQQARRALFKSSSKAA